MTLEEKENYHYEQIAKQIEREDGLVNIRLTWMLSTQGLLFAALALLSQQEVSRQFYDVMIKVLPWTGMIMGLMGLIGVSGAHRALKKLKRHWDDTGYKNIQRFVPPFGGKTASVLGFLPSIIIPPTFIVAWLMVLTNLHPTEIKPQPNIIQKPIPVYIVPDPSISTKK